MPVILSCQGRSQNRARHPGQRRGRGRRHDSGGAPRGVRVAEVVDDVGLLEFDTDITDSAFAETTAARFDDDMREGGVSFS